MSSIAVTGNASGTGTQTLQSANTNSSVTASLPDLSTNYSLGFLNAPISSTTSTVTTSDIGKVISLSAGITIPNSTFSAGDIVSLYNNTASALTITCSITTAYVAGTNSDVGTMSLASRGVATVLFLSATECVVSGNVS